MRNTINTLFIALGWTSIGLALIGVFVPLLPTTPLALVGAACFARGSPRLHRWLRQHRRIGRPIRDWEDHRVVPVKGKITAGVGVPVMAAYPLVTFDIPLWVRVAIALVLLANVLYVCTRPSKAR